jgi:thiosulfate reductase cytochrome b subunit
MSERLYFYPVWVRIWHWINALMFIVLILTGLSMQYSSPDFPFIRFDLAVSWHNIAGFTVSIIYILFVLFNRFSFNRKYYNFRRKGFIERLQKQIQFYTVGIFKGEAPPYVISKNRKFNPLQKLSYLAVMYVLMPIVILSGLALFFPEIIITNVWGVSGIYLTALLHIITGFLLSVFMVIHIYFSTIGTTPLSNFKGMFSGYHE